MQVVIADPPAFTPAYDHELAAALARAGADVELVSSRFRFGEAPRPEGYLRSEPFYPLSSRLFRRSPLRLPLKAVEHVPGMIALLRRHPSWTHASSARASRLSSPPTISSRGARREDGSSGAGCSPGSTGSSSTASEVAGPWPTWGSTRT